MIHTTSRRLIDFVERYRCLTRIPTPVMGRIELVPWIERLVTLFDRPIEIRSIDRSLVLYADADQLAQVVTNLLKNAVEATTPKQTIWVELSGHGQTMIEVGNTGPEI